MMHVVFFKKIKGGLEMSVIQIGLVDTTGSVNPELVQGAAAALNLQVMRDLPQFWNVQATVRYLPDPHKIPAGVWPVQLVKSLPPGEGGFHLDKHNQPYAKVIAGPKDDSWTIDASHETIEMLVDPSGNRVQSSFAIEIKGNKIVDGTGQFNYLVEACDPCEANDCGYTVLGVVVSDFITPHFYDPVVTPGTRYSFTGAVKAPRQILPGGYVSFVNLQTDEWEQILFVDPSKPPQLVNLGPASGKSIREWIDNGMTKMKTHAKQENTIRNRAPKLAKRDQDRRDKLAKVAAMRGRLYAR
jgi:hypothetical protein